jgi:hypothetical protein
VTKYRETAEKGIEEIKDRLFSEGYKNYGEFLEDFNQLKGRFERETGTGADKWAFFGEMSESVHRLAGETITQKMNNALQLEKQILEEKIQLREAEYKERREEFDGERQRLRYRVEELERQVARLTASEASAQQRLK